MNEPVVAEPVQDVADTVGAGEEEVQTDQAAEAAAEVAAEVAEDWSFEPFLAVSDPEVEADEEDEAGQQAAENGVGEVSAETVRAVEVVADEEEVQTVQAAEVAEAEEAEEAAGSAEFWSFEPFLAASDLEVEADIAEAEEEAESAEDWSFEPFLAASDQDFEADIFEADEEAGVEAAQDSLAEVVAETAEIVLVETFSAEVVEDEEIVEAAEDHPVQLAQESEDAGRETVVEEVEAVHAVDAIETAEEAVTERVVEVAEDNLVLERLIEPLEAAEESSSSSSSSSASSSSALSLLLSSPSPSSSASVDIPFDAAADSKPGIWDMDDNYGADYHSDQVQSFLQFPHPLIVYQIVELLG